MRSGKTGWFPYGSSPPSREEKRTATKMATAVAIPRKVKVLVFIFDWTQGMVWEL